MPEYLSPNVYVEEVDTGSKPIEGVSTSTAGMFGVTERGPSNVPILVTSYGEFTRWFGDRLDPSEFLEYSFLPHAVEGFFTNGGKRLYLTRIEAQGAARASFELHDRGEVDSPSTRLLRPAPEASGIAGSALYVLDTAPPGASPFATGDRIRIGSGSETEYRDIAHVGVAGEEFHVPVSLPLSRAHVAGGTLHEIDEVASGAPAPLFAGVERGDATIVVTGSAGAFLPGDLIEIDGAGLAELRFVATVTAVSATESALTLDSPLALEHPAAALVGKLDATLGAVSDTLDVPAAASGGVAFASTPSANFKDRSHIVLFDVADPVRREARRIGRLAMLSIEGAFDDYPAGSVVARVSMGPTADPPAVLTAVAQAGTTAVTVNDRTSFAVGTVVQVGVAPQLELATVAAIPQSSPIAPNAGTLVLSHVLRNGYPAGATIQALTTPILQSDRPAAGVLLDVRRADLVLPVDDGGVLALDQYVAGDTIRVTTGTGGVYYHLLTTAEEDYHAFPVTLGVAVERPHPVGSQIAGRAPLLRVEAIDTGNWGNRLRVSVEDELPGLVSRTTIASTITANRMRVSSLTGIEAGTVLEIVETSTGLQLGDPIKVESVDRPTMEVRLDALAPLSAIQFASLFGAPSGAYQIRSREFRLTARLLRHPDPTVPSRDGSVLDREIYRYLSMDPRHSRYVETVIGDIFGAPRLSDRRPDGESWYLRVSDVSPSNALRLGPETLIDLLPGGRIAPAQHPLSRGDDSLVTLNDASYIGADDVNPEARTGLFSLANVEDISIVACPGRTSVQIQSALISHCETLRYRFAVLDGQSPPSDSIEDIVTQRQQYDSKYAALYHPWLLVAQPFPVSAATPPEFAIPPSGHVVGVFARTDIERGVHKAPANEVVRGILGLQRSLNKEQHDVLNPYPVNVNVIRDFRNEARGIRVYGGRCITSDTDWKYVNVRRLLLFVEKSINNGLQWVVFEPNAEALWARVRRSIANFLTLVWRNGALEGTKPDEAFFVKCDRTTMTQTDIDSGRLICVVGVAPVKPAEFVIVRIGLWTANADD